MSRAARPEGPAADGARIEPDEDQNSGVVEQWLSDAEFDEGNERLERLLGDQELLLSLQLGRYSAKVWDPVAEELARYGVAVILSWIRRRLIFPKVQKRTGYGLSVAPDHWLEDDHVARDLADETVVRAINYFKDHVLRKNKWDASKGASLRTYFIGQCLFQFPNVYKSWFNQERDRRAAEYLADDDDLDFLRGSIRGIESTVMAKVEVSEALARVKTDHARRAIVMHHQGYTYDEIATKLGLANAKTVENMLAYQKRLLRRGA